MSFKDSSFFTLVAILFDRMKRSRQYWKEVLLAGAFRQFGSGLYLGGNLYIFFNFWLAAKEMSF